MQYERNNKLITSKFWQYFFPTVLSVFACNMAVVVDAVIVSLLVGVESLSGLQVMYPIISTMDLLSWMIGLGGSLLCASAKAKFDEEKANRIYSVSIISILIISILLVIIGLLYPEMIIGYLSDPLHPNIYALEYFKMYVYGIPFFSFMLTMFYFVGVDGMPEFTSKALIIASIMDPIMDVVFIYFLKMGIAGSGLGTSISFIVGSLYISTYFLKSNRTLKFVKVKITTFIKSFINICKSGFAGASTQLYLTIAMLSYNSIIFASMGNMGLFSQQICTDVLLIISIFFIGLVETASPLLSVYFSDKDYGAIEYIKNISFKFLAIVSVIFAGISVFFPQIILSLYTVNAQYSAFVSNALRLYGLSFLTLGFIFFFIFYTQAIQKNKLANIVSLFFNLILVLVMLVILPGLFGENGIWITPFAVGLVTITGIIIYSKYMTKKSNGEYHGIYINKYPDENYYDFSIQGNTNEVKELISIIRTKLENNKFSDTTCSTLEEYLLYIIQTDKLDTIDIALDVSEESIQIFIKDLGHKREDFTFKNEAEYNRKIDYSEVIGLNNTLITIN